MRKITKEMLMRAAKIVHIEILRAQFKFKGSLIDEQYDNNHCFRSDDSWRIQLLRAKQRTARI